MVLLHGYLQFYVWGKNLLRLCSHTPDGVCQIEEKMVKSKELHDP